MAVQPHPACPRPGGLTARKDFIHGFCQALHAVDITQHQGRGGIVARREQRRQRNAFTAQGFQQTHPLPEPDNNRQSTATGEGIADALDAIYFDVSIMGVQDATAERLASDFGVDTSCLSAVYGRYTDGRFGIADVILVVPKPGQEASARDLLVTIRTSRAGLFANYDIYGASELAENGVIYTLGDYYVLLMINDTDHVRELLEQYIPT